MSTTGGPVRVELTREEAIVLFEMLSRHSETDVLAIQDRAEEFATWRLCGALEKALAEPFAPDYAAILQRARHALLERAGQDA
jgi:hypothetical protein